MERGELTEGGREQVQKGRMLRENSAKWKGNKEKWGSTKWRAWPLWQTHFSLLDQQENAALLLRLYFFPRNLKKKQRANGFGEKYDTEGKGGGGELE